MADKDVFGGIGEALAEYETNPVFAWKDFAKYFNPTANQFRNFIQHDAKDLYNQFKTDYLAGGDAAKANAKVYQDYARSLFGSQPNQFANYQQVGDYLYGKLDQFSNSLKDSGLRDMNARLAGLGIRPGSTGYDRLLNATRITNNLAPAFANTTNAIGNDYARLSGNDIQQTLLRLGLANSDALSGYADRVAARPLDVANARYGQLAMNNRLYGDLVGNYMRNVAGYTTENTSDWSKAFTALGGMLNGAVDLYAGSLGGMGGMGGGMGGLGGMGSGGGGGSQSSGQNPYYQFYQNLFNRPQTSPGTPSGYVPMMQNQAWSTSYTPQYLGDRAANPYLQYGMIPLG